SVLNAAGLFAWFVTAALYLQHVLHYDPFQVGLCFLPADVLMAAFSAGLSARMVVRFGIRGPLCAGLVLSATGLAVFARAPIDGTFSLDVLPGMLLLGLGSGVALNPLLLAATNDVGPHESGLASGLINTSFTLGGALGLAVLSSLAAVRTAGLVAAGAAASPALNGGYHLAFLLGAILTSIAALGSLALRAAPGAAADASTETPDEISAEASADDSAQASART
ncbi:MAG: MFS transporter, partial [Steroidobacteraceae bacterium]